MQMSGGGYNNIIGELVESTVTKAIYLAESNNNLFNVSYVSGTGNAGFDSYYSSYTFNGNTNYLYPFGGTRITFNGYAATIKSSSTITGGAICTSLVVNGDYGDSGSVTALIQGSGSITVSAGVANIKLSKSCTYLATTVSGGVLNFENTRFEDGYFYGAGYDFVISGGRVNLNNLQSELVDRSYSFKLTGGILDLGSSRTKNNSSNFVTFANTNIGRQSGIYWTGGTIISNGARIITQTDDCLAIQAVSSGLSMKVLSGGFNTTNTTNITTAKKQKVKCTVSSVLSTSITLNDGSGGDEIFTEANTGVYNTLALLAQRMVSLINASATLDITATQDTPGTDAYFYLESDVAGTAFTIPTYANIGIVLVRPNSNSFTVLCGGSIIQDINID